MTTILKRGNVYHFAVTKGGTRLRCSLGVSDLGAAKRLANRVEFALADGPKSGVWAELRPALPAASFKTLTDGLSVAAASPGLKEFERKFLMDLMRRTQLGQITASTARLYERVAESFFKWLVSQGIGKMDGVFDQDVDDYLLFRRKQLLARNPGKGARGLETESKILQAVLSFAVSSGAIQTSPLRELYKSDVPASEPEPFTAAELQLMDDAAEGETRLVYLLMRWTGLRVSDVAALTWSAVDLEKRTLTWLTQKRKKLVCVPLSEELTAELEKYRGADGEKIVPGATRARLYTMIKALGEKAGVENVHPHRFRANFACFLLSKGATLHDVAEILGDKTSTVEVYYARFTDGAKDRIRNVLSS
jgi:integrase